MFLLVFQDIVQHIHAPDEFTEAAVSGLRQLLGLRQLGDMRRIVRQLAERCQNAKMQINRDAAGDQPADSDQREKQVLCVLLSICRKPVDCKAQQRSFGICDAANDGIVADVGSERAAVVFCGEKLYFDRHAAAVDL